MTKKTRIICTFFVLLFAFSCKKEPSTPINESELITTLKLTLIDSAAPVSSYTFIWKDIDGEGGTNPSIDSVLIPAGKTYFASLLLLDERDASAIDTTSNEIEEENTVHQFFYKSTPTDVISNFNYLTFDDNGKPLGTEFKCKTKATVSNGKLKITLRHQPNKDGANVANNDITNAAGETDLETEFPVRLY